MPLGTAGEATYANPTITVPVSVERDFYGRNVVQVSGPIASQSGAGFVGAGQLVPVPTGRTDAEAASAGTSAVTPVQPGESQMTNLCLITDILCMKLNLTGLCNSRGEIQGQLDGMHFMQIWRRHLEVAWVE